jgi:hypothetical protein
MKRLLVGCGIGLALACVAILSAQLIGGLRSADPRSFAAGLWHDTHLTPRGWCWRGICAGHSDTTALVAAVPHWGDLMLLRRGSASVTFTTLQLDSKQVPRWKVIVLTQRNSPKISRLQIQPELNTLTLGEVVVALGAPATRQAEFAYGLWTTLICYPQRLCAGIIENARDIGPHTRVDFVVYAVADEPLAERVANLTHVWRGFHSPGVTFARR